jgi:hypothetical protein
MSRKLALIIGNSEYQDPTLARLVTPNEDVNDLAEVLRAPEIGEFDEVTTLVNEPSANIRLEVESFFAEKKPDDLLVLYFSGHGVRDDQGQLYLAVKDTRHNRLRATAIPAAFITDGMDHSRSRRQVLILDCCHSGAFAQGTKGAPGASVGTASAFEGTGYGRVVLTATDSTQYAWEGDEVIGEAENSVFTHYLIEGLRTGAADMDADGRITLDELYDYVYEQVVNKTPKQTPGKSSYKQQGEFVIARNPRPVVKPVELPAELRQAIESPFAGMREGVVRELERLLYGSHPGLTLAAFDALKRLAEDDSRRVSVAAAQVMAAYTEAQNQEETRRQREAEAARAQREAEAERLAALKVEQERIARSASRAEAERAAAQKTELERLAREKSEQERLERERAEAERAAAQKAELERLARDAERAEAERKAQEKAERAEQERVARAQAERVERERVEAERAAAQKAELERLARDAERAEAERKAKTEAEQRARLAAEKTEPGRRRLDQFAAQPPAIQHSVEPPLTTDLAGRITAFVQAMWLPILITVIAWGSGWLIGVSLGDILYTFLSDNKLPGAEYVVGAASSLVSAGLGGFGTALALRRARSSFQWKQVLMVIGAWVVSVVIGWGLYETTPSSLSTSLTIAGALGGLGTGLILRSIEPAFQGKQIVAAAIGWAIALFVGSLAGDPRGVNLAIQGGVVGLIGGGVMFWALSQMRTKAEHITETPAAGQPPSLQRDMAHLSTMNSVGRVTAFAQAMWLPVLLTVIGWSSGWLIGGSLWDMISSFLSDNGFPGGDYTTYGIFLLITACMGGVGTALAMRQVRSTFQWKHALMVIGAWVVSAAIGWGLFVATPDLFNASAAMVGALGGLGIGLILRSIEPAFQGRRIVVAAIGWAIALYISSLYTTYGAVNLIIQGGVVGLMGGVVMFWALSEGLAAEQR